jgi:hypothetical protein
MSSCCGSSDLVGDSFADIISRISHLPRAIAHEYVNVRERGDESDVFVLYFSAIIVVGTIVFTFKLTLTWLCSSIRSRIHTAQGGNPVMAISSSAEEISGHAPLQNLDCRSST